MMVKKVLIGIAAALLILQFFRGSAPEVSMDNTGDFLANEEVPENIATTLRSSCYDCHSNETKYPFYSYVTPVSWVIFNHIEEGREELNFSEWMEMKKRRKIRKLKEVAEEVEDGKMPIKGYTMIHGDARLSEDQARELITWAEEYASVVMSR